MLKVGDKFKKKLKIYDTNTGGAKDTVVDAEVVYIHPKMRFCTLRYQISSRYSYCESEFLYPKGEMKL